MGFYSTMSGELQYANAADFDTVVSALEAGEWLLENCFVTEDGERVNAEDGPDVDITNLRINLPFGLYRNLRWQELFVGEAKGSLVGTSTDGTFSGWYVEDGKCEEVDLFDWAKTHMPDGERVAPPFDDFDAYCEWQERVSMAYLESCGA